MAGLIVLVVFFVLMWVLFILPQQRRVKAQQEYVASLQVGDDVVTAGGVYGTIAGLTETTVDLVVADGIVLTFARAAINAAQPPVAAASEESDAAETDT
mgnify:CR=1 FL=1